MMNVPMDKMSPSSLRERAQHLYDKSLELENKIRRSAQEHVPSDPNAWQQMRENYEAIALEDHAFSEQQNVEYALWQLHYRRIEELRAQFSTALASTTAITSQDLKSHLRLDRVSKIRLQFKTFLSEATGFYHDLIVKLRARYGLPLNHISEDSDNKIAMEKNGKQSADLKKGLVSCHRCLIYLGDLARYKGLYGEADARTREYGAASSYYLQASSICPSSGNPHHQLAILASYSGYELVAIYRYFRSLAVDNPFTTARDNLIVAFEKNRQSFSQLSVDVVKAPLLKVSAAPARLAGKGGKMEAKYAPKPTTKRECSPVNDRPKSTQELCKFFCVRFVRLNGLLFTRTSLETFADVLTLVTSDLCELLSSGPDEKLNFGADASDNALFAVRLVAILVYTVHNLKKEGEGQTYADIVQRAVLLQNGFTAVFQLMGLIVETCLQVHDIYSSFLLPGILVFLEWITCCPDVAMPTSDMDEKQSTSRSSLWKNVTLFLNKISEAGSMFVDNEEDEACFFSMSQNKNGETDNRIALWEDFELRGFLPLLPAHSILDFSRKQSVGSDGMKEKKVRVDRILAAGKALVNVIKVDQQTVYFDQKTKKFVIAVEPSEDEARPFFSGPPRVNGVMQDNSTEKKDILDSMHVNSTSREGFVDDDDEVIVFKPAVAEKKMNAIGHGLTQSNGLKNGENNSTDSSNFFSVSVSPPANISEYSASDPSPPALNGGITPRSLQQVHPNGLAWSLEQGSLANSLKSFALFENGHSAEQKVPASYGLYHPTIHQPSRVSNGATFYNQINPPERVLSSTIDATAGSGFGCGNLSLNTSVALPVGSLKSSVGRPASHLGPPPGFSCVSKPLDARSASDLDSPIMDDYRWLDGYNLTSSMKSAGLNDHAISNGNAQYVNNNGNGFSGAVNFPFPGKQIPSVQFQSEKQKVFHDHQTLEQLKFKADLKLQQQQLSNGNQQNISLPDQCQGQFVWTGQYFV